MLVSGEILKNMPAAPAGVRQTLSGIRAVLPLRRSCRSLRADNRVDSGASPVWEGWRLQAVRVLAISVHDPLGEPLDRFVGLAAELPDDRFIVI